MPGSARGATRAAATRLGVPFDEYVARRAAGEKWCSRCKGWHPKEAFGSDASHPDGLSSRCLHPVIVVSPEERVWRFIDRNGPGGCWLWTGGIDRAGYGLFGLSPNVHRLAHRYTYELLVGPIPSGLQIDHLCRVHNCVNPAHLEPVTARENLLRGETANARNARKTHCKNGHEFSEENTYRVPNGRRAGNRKCRACERVYKREWLKRREVLA